MIMIKKYILALIVLFFSNHFLYANEEGGDSSITPEEYKTMIEWDGLRDQISHDDNYTGEKWDAILGDYRIKLRSFSGEQAKSLEMILERAEKIHKKRKKEIENEQNNKMDESIAVHFGGEGPSFQFIQRKRKWLDSRFDLRLDDAHRPHILFMARSPNPLAPILNEHGFNIEWHDTDEQSASLAVQYNHQDETQWGLFDVETRCGFDFGGALGRRHNGEKTVMLRGNIEARMKLLQHISLELKVNPNILSGLRDYRNLDDSLKAELQMQYPLSSQGWFLDGMASHTRIPGSDDFNTLELGIRISY